jgi:crossover junction endodeoxyribonuclease RuvC
MLDRVIGVDPGVHGAIAVLRVEPDGKLTISQAFDLPTVKVRGKEHLLLAAIANALLPYQGMPAFIELVGAAPGQGTSSMFRFGYAAGAIAGILAALHCPTTQLRPQDWQKLVGVAANPDAGRLRAAQLYPAEAYRFALKKDHNLADACLIATAGARLAARPVNNHSLTFPS